MKDFAISIGMFIWGANISGARYQSRTWTQVPCRIYYVINCYRRTLCVTLHVHIALCYRDAPR